MSQNIVTGTTGPDRLFGTAGVDLINGLSGKDHLHGLAGDDDLHGGFDNDLLWGGPGNDLYFVDTPGEQVFERPDEGEDTVISSISYQLGTNFERLLLSGGTDPLSATGNALDNELIGNAGANMLNGRGGNDILTGLDGSDVYVFDTKPGPGNVDVVNQFIAAEDFIALDSDIFSGLSSPVPFHIGATAADGNTCIMYDPTSGALLYDRDGTGSAQAVQFATLVGLGGTLSADNFLVV